MRSRTTACWCFRGSASNPKRRWRSAAGSARSTTPPTAIIRSPGIYPVTLDKSKNSSADYLRATFDWHIDGCTPTEDDVPPEGDCAVRRSRSPRRGGETEFASSYARLRRTERRGEGAVRVVAGRAFAGGLAAAGHPRPVAGDAGAVEVAPHPRASAGVDASQRPQVTGARRVGRLHRRHGSRRGQGAAGRTARPGHRAPTRCTATRGRSATPSSGTTAVFCTGRHRTTRTRRGRCCAPPCWATSRSSRPTPSLTAASHYGNLIPKDENHVLVQSRSSKRSSAWRRTSPRSTSSGTVV